MAPLNWHINRRSLEAQAFGPLVSQPHMRGNADYNAGTVGEVLTNRIKAIQDYVALFDQAFNTSGGNGVTKDNIGKAIANFERSIVSKNSPYDQYVQGQRDALTINQKKGLLLFYGKANCASCHAGPMFSDFGLYSLGIKHNDKVATPDKGNSENKYLFRTPSLRNVTLTAPFMHNGTIGTLKEVVAFYNQGVSQNPDILPGDIAIRPLGLSETEIDDITAFLHALTDDAIDKTIPASVPSGLPVGGS
jgi:cytochrome c peroxidase